MDKLSQTLKILALALFFCLLILHLKGTMFGCFKGVADEFKKVHEHIEKLEKRLNDKEIHEKIKE